MQPNQPPAQQAAGHHYYAHQQPHQQHQNVAASYLGGAHDVSHPQHVASAAGVAVAAPPPLPPGWVAIVDPNTGRTYYGNPLTGDTSWEVPALPPPPPAAPTLPIPPPHQQQQAWTGTTSSSHGGGSIPNMHASDVQVTAAAPPAAIDSKHDNVISSASIPGTMNYLVPQVRVMMDAEQTAAAAATSTAVASSSSSSKAVLPPPSELADLTAGAVADLVNVKREQVSSPIDGEEFVLYEPIEPYKLPVLARPPHIEPGRVEIRANLLYDKLEKL